MKYVTHFKGKHFFLQHINILNPTEIIREIERLENLEKIEVLEKMNINK